MSRTTLIAGLLALAPAALAQVSGYSAGPSENARSGYREVDGGTPPLADAGVPAGDAGVPPGGSEDDGYRTRVVSFKKSPGFTQDREFPSIRLWVLDPGSYTVEQWWHGYYDLPRVGTGPYGRYPDGDFFQTEIEMGVAKHIQIDIYANEEFDRNQSNGSFQLAGANDSPPGGHTGVAAELRIALGDYWGQIFANPTLYFELSDQYYNSPRAEFRLLLGGELFTPKLLGALNLDFERNIFYDDFSGIDYEIKADYGVNYEVVKDILRLGFEGVLGFDSHGIPTPQPGGFAIGAQDVFPVALIGPSFLLTEPHKRIKLLAAFLFGLADYDQPYQPTVIVSTTF
ncbi:MAG: hypothetical protein ACYDCL_01400 [Myxococcales bacterium]